MKIRPLTQYLGPLGKPEEGGMSRDEAARKGRAIKQMVESEGWTVLKELVERLQRYEQKQLMYGKPKPEEEQISYERLIGIWAGMDRIDGIVEGAIQYGEQAERELDATARDAAEVA